MKSRLFDRMRGVGLRDGIWTLAATLGSKLQVLAVLAAAGHLGDVNGVGDLILATSTGYLLAALADLGVGTQATRVYAAGQAQQRRTLITALLSRTALLITVGPGVCWLVLERSGLGIGWILLTSLYALCVFWSLTITNLAYGCGRFKEGASLNGWVRSLTIPFAVAAAALSLQIWTLLALLVTSEIIIASIQYVMVPKQMSHNNDADDAAAAKSLFSIRFAWKFGVASIANTLMNRSDTVVVSLIATSAVGVYGIASQVQNALTTAAFVPAGALLAHTARSQSASEARRAGVTVSCVVFLIYLVLALPFMIAPEWIVRLAFSSELNDGMAVRICVIAGFLSCVGGVLMRELTGHGQRNMVALIWISTAAIAVVFLALGALVLGATGAALGALGRDIVFFGATLIFLKRYYRADERREVLNVA